MLVYDKVCKNKQGTMGVAKQDMGGKGLLEPAGIAANCCPIRDHIQIGHAFRIAF